MAISRRSCFRCPDLLKNTSWTGPYLIMSGFIFSDVSSGSPSAVMTSTGPIPRITGPSRPALRKSSRVAMFLSPPLQRDANELEVVHLAIREARVFAFVVEHVDACHLQPSYPPPSDSAIRQAFLLCMF